MRKSALVFFGLVTAILVALGLVVLSTASGANGLYRYHDAYFFVKRQGLYIAAGVVLATMTAMVDYRRWRDEPFLTWVLFAVVFLMLLAVFPPLGRSVKGSYRWINLGFFNIQPGEIAKLTVVIVLAYWLDHIGWRVELFKSGALIPCLLIGVLAVPVMFEPDFGSTFVIGLAGFLVMIVAGTRFLHLTPFAAIGVVVVAAKVLSNPNRMARIAAWLGIQLNVGAQVASKAAQAAEWQGDMALAAIGRGGLWGVGLGQSMQKHAYLPEAHTDMIFAIGAEELGILFSIAVLVLFLVFFAYSIYIAYNASDRFGRSLVVGMSFVIFFAAMFNLGVVCEALPMKGMALPFFSYGGTNMLCAFFAVGTILSVGIHSYNDKKHALVSKVVMRSR